jgi:hypothetical protein
MSIIKLFYVSLLLIGVSDCIGTNPDEGEIDPHDAAPTQNDAGSGHDVSSDSDSPFALEYGTYDGTLTTEDTIDVLGFSWKPGDHILVKVTPESNLDVSLFVGAVNNGGMGEPEIYQATSDSKSDIKKLVVPISQVLGSGNYVLEISAQPQDDAGQGTDAPYDDDQPLPIIPGTYKGFVGSDDEFDDYAVQLKANQTVTVVAEPDSTLDIAISKGIYDYSANTTYLVEGQELENNGFVGQKETISQTIGIDPAIYKFSINKVGKTSGTYKLTVTIN